MVGCKRISGTTPGGNSKRVEYVAQKYPQCKCEGCRTSYLSPGIVGETETLSRFIYDPLHTNKNGKIMPSAYSHVFTNGCSVQREEKATDQEITRLVKNFLSAKAGRKWLGVTQANCGKIREISIDGDDQKIFCVYDTAEKKNHAHAEIFTAKYLPDDGSQNEARILIKDAIKGTFKNNELTLPQSYRSGRITKTLNLPLEEIDLFLKTRPFTQTCIFLRLLWLAIKDISLKCTPPRQKHSFTNQ